MSCSVECIVAIYTVPKLLIAIEALAAAVAETQTAQEDAVTVKQETELEDCVGKKIAVDLVIENAYGDRIGVRAAQPVESKEQPLEFVFQDANSATARKTIDRIRQAYARLQIINELKSKGYKDIKEERLANGSIRLVVQKWQ